MSQLRKRGSVKRLVVAVLLMTLAIACSRAREYELRGQILAVDRGRREITIKHEDIKGFMPGMTMPFKVRDERLLEGREPGDLVLATLVVEDASGYLKTIERTGHAALTETPRLPHADILDVGDTVPDTPLVDETGAARPLSAWRGKALAVTFIYTRCPLSDFCPLMDRQFAEVQQLIAEDPSLRGRVHLLSVSFDPAYDTPPVLETHARKVGADPATWSFMTGDDADVATFAARFGVAITREGSDPANVVHNLRTAVIDGNGRLVKVINGMQWAASELVADLRTAVAAR